MEDKTSENHKKALEDDLKAYTKLERINKSDEFNDFFSLQMDTACKKLLELVTGNGPKDWDEFCKKRGEIVSIIYPIQQIRGAKFLKEQLTKQLNDYYNSEPS